MTLTSLDASSGIFWIECPPNSTLMPGASHEFLEHTSELELRVRAPSFPKLLCEAGRAVGLLMLRDAAHDASGPWRTLTVSSADRAGLLVDWLNELIYQAETAHWVPTEMETDSVTDTFLEIRARGVAVKEAPALIKAATLHNVQVREVDDGVEAEVILDI